MSHKQNKSFGKLPARYSFAINEHTSTRISKCPHCGNNTFQRKFPLVIAVKEAPLVSLGFTCKYCAKCEFIIAHKDELEHELCIAFEKIDPTKIGNDYFVVGTVNKNKWKKGLNTPGTLGDTIDWMADFKNYLSIEFDPGGWRRE
jgi:hypothetical protein